MKSTFDITEAQFQAQIRQLAATFGFSVYCTWRSIHSPAGFPDLVLAKSEGSAGRLLFIELKAEKRQPTPAQSEWLELLGRIPFVEVYLWRPSDWEDAVRILRGTKEVEQ